MAIAHDVALCSDTENNVLLEPAVAKRSAQAYQQRTLRRKKSAQVVTVQRGAGQFRTMALGAVRALVETLPNSGGSVKALKAKPECVCLIARIDA